jgi:hypothetical protein
MSTTNLKVYRTRAAARRKTRQAAKVEDGTIDREQNLGPFRVPHIASKQLAIAKIPPFLSCSSPKNVKDRRQIQETQSFHGTLIFNC